MKKILILAVILLALYKIADKFFPERTAEFTAKIGILSDYIPGKTSTYNKSNEEEMAQRDEDRTRQQELVREQQDALRRNLSDYKDRVDEQNRAQEEAMKRMMNQGERMDREREMIKSGMEKLKR